MALDDTRGLLAIVGLGRVVVLRLLWSSNGGKFLNFLHASQITFISLSFSLLATLCFRATRLGTRPKCPCKRCYVLRLRACSYGGLSGLKTDVDSSLES